MSDKIIVCGFARSGTSIMFLCLKNSGFFPGKDKLRGWRYKTENASFIRLNRLVSRTLGAGQLIKDITGSVVVGADIMTPPKSRRTVNPHEVRGCGLLLQKIKDAEILKDPQCAFSLESLIKHDRKFREAKYIWTRRNLEEQARSLIRLKTDPDHGDRKVYKKYMPFETALTICEAYDGELWRVMPLVDHVVVWLEEFLKYPEKIKDKVSAFIGRDLNLDAFDLGKTYHV
jgi:hypothetical protein